MKAPNRILKYFILSISLLVNAISMLLIESVESENFKIALTFTTYLPIIVFGIYYGIWGGLICALSLVFINFTIDFMVSDSVFRDNVLVAFYGTTIVVGGITGYISSLNKKLKTTLDQKDVLLHEIHHRVKNNLAIIVNFIGLERRDIAKREKNMEDILFELEERVKSIGLIHEKLYMGKDFESVDFYDYCKSISKDIIDNFTKKENLHIDLEIEQFRASLKTDTVVPLGLVLTEIITNALKYGFRDRQRGVIKISFDHYNNNYRLVIENDGHLIENDQKIEETPKLGMRIIKALLNQLNAKLTIQSEDKVRFIIEFTTNPSS